MYSIPGADHLERLADSHHHLWDLSANRYPWWQGEPEDPADPSGVGMLQRNYLVADLLADTAGLPLIASVHVEAAHDPADPVDTLIVAGGQGVMRAAEDANLIEWLTLRAGAAWRTASVCTGAFLLAAAGLLDHRRAVTHWEYCDELSRRHPAVIVEPDPIFAAIQACTEAERAEAETMCQFGEAHDRFREEYGSEEPDAIPKVVREGWRMRVYIPFGVAWYPYLMRRLAERPANVWFIARNLFRK